MVSASAFVCSSCFLGGCRVCCLAYNVVLVCEGPFNSWDRQVWEWMDDSSGVPTKSIIKKYDEIKGNFFIGFLNDFFGLPRSPSVLEFLDLTFTDVQAITMARRRSTTTTAPRITTRTTSE